MRQVPTLFAGSVVIAWLPVLPSIIEPCRELCD